MTILAILDFDGTLFNTQAAIAKCLQLTLQNLNDTIIDLDEIAKSISLGGSLKTTFSYLLNKPESSLDLYVDNYRALYEKSNIESQVNIYPSVKQILKLWHEDGVKLVILSNKGQKAILSLLKRHKLDNYIHLIIGNKPYVPTKPSSAPFENLIKPFFHHHTFENTLVIGDTPPDLQFANNIGAISIWASYGYGNHQQCLSHNPNHIITEFSQLKNIIQKPLSVDVNP
jgi:phosphoglycolate phosphatase